MLLGGKLGGYTAKLFDADGNESGIMNMNSYGSILFVKRGSYTQKSIDSEYDVKTPP
jgi:hypothetical protein